MGVTLTHGYIYIYIYGVKPHPPSASARLNCRGFVEGFQGVGGSEFRGFWANAGIMVGKRLEVGGKKGLSGIRDWSWMKDACRLVENGV